MATRISPAVDVMMWDAISRDLHVTRSEFVRDAIIEYIRTNWPDIFDKHRRRRRQEGGET